MRAGGRAVALAALLAASANLRGIVFVASDDSEFNTSAPAGELANSGWQWQGNWRGFGGTPIAPNLFLTAQHVGGSAGDAFLFTGQRYPTLAGYTDPQSDLMIWKICGEFPTFAPLYAGNAEVGAACVVFGHGLGRGTAVTVADGNNPGLRGWFWGSTDGRLRWGENVIAGIEAGAWAGAQLTAVFNEGGGPNEAMLAGGDSGSGLFIHDAGEWKLAGVNFSVDGPFRQIGSDKSFSAALFDKRRLLEPGAGSRWTLVPDGGVPVPAAFYATRVSARLDWIRGVMAAEAQREPSPTVEAAAGAEGPYSPVQPLLEDASQRTILVPLPAGDQFLRLRHCRAVKITQIAARPATLELHWE